MMLVLGCAAAVAVRPLYRAVLKVVTAKSARGAAVVFLNWGVRLSLGRLVTSTVPAPAEATLLTRKLTSVAAPVATGVMAPVGLALAPAAGSPWKMLLAPPRMLTRSPEPNRPPAPR